MNSKVTDKDGFSYVSYKGKKKKSPKPPICSSFVTRHSPESLHNFDTIMTDIQEELKHSDFIINFKENLYDVLKEWNLRYLTPSDTKDDFLNVSNECIFANDIEEGIDIVCYGLGKFSSCIIARYQLGFLLLLKHILHSTKVYIYDPQFSIEEINFLKELGMNVLIINEEAKRKLKGKSICFMPHCDLPLYNNLLWANWSAKSLSEIVIIGNSFENYELNDVRSRFKERAKYVYLANKFVTEIRMTNTFHFTDIFNDLSIHYFKLDSLTLVDSLWTDADEPEYSDDDNIIKKKKSF